MRPEDWERAEEWFHRLAPLDAGDRSRLLAEVSAERPDLGSEIASLLAAHDSQGLLDHLTDRLAPVLPHPGAPADPLVGASVGHYEITALVGRGGMGDVYRATDTRLERDVALKFLPEWLRRDPDARDRFLAEARIVSSIDHPNVCALLEMGETEDGRSFLILPFYEGETLKQRLTRGPLPADEVLLIALQTARGLAAAHARGIVHRDVKPANLLLTSGGRVKILDFGVAKLADVELTRTGQTPGTMVYMSPEQVAGHAVDARTDLWSLGVVLFETLTGERPETVRDDVLAPDDPGPGSLIPRGVADVLSRLLARNPEQRYTDARALAEDLAALASGSDAAAGRPGGRPAASSRRFLVEAKGHVAAWLRRPMRLAGVLGAILVVGAGAWWVAGSGGESGDRRGDAAAVPVAAAGQAVAVLPFQISGEGEALRSWHEGIVHLLSGNLETVEGLRKIDPARVMTAWEAWIGESAARMNPDSAPVLARSLGARYVVSGSAVAVGAGSAMRLTAEVRDVDAGTVLGSEAVEVPVDSLSSADRLAIALLRKGLLPSDSDTDEPPDLARVSTRSFPAFSAYLQGERAYRRGEYAAAARSFVRATELDSMFARAMYRSAQSYMWTLNYGLEDEYRRRAERLAPRLPRRDSLLFASYPLDQSPGAIPHLERFTRLYPDDLDGWFSLGDAYVHLGGRALRPPSDYRRALTKAIELGGSYEKSYIHLIEDAFARRDRQAVRSLLDRHAGSVGGIASCPGYELAYAGAWGDDARVAEQAAAIATADLACGWVTLAASAAATDEMERRDLELVEAGDGAISVFWRLAQARVMRGELDRARRVLDAARRAGFEEWAARYEIAFHLVGLADASTADDAASVLAAQVPGRSVETGAQAGWFWLGALAIEERRWDDVEPAARNLETAADSIRVAAAGMDLGRGRRARRFADGADRLAAVLRSYAAQMRSRDDDLDALDAALGRVPPSGFLVEGPAEFIQYRMGTDLLDRGELRAAERYFLSLYPYAWAFYVPAQYHLGRLYEQLGDADRAREHYRSFVEWWETADPELQPWVDEGRAALARLGGG